jgi:hypothetical protein
MDALGGPNSRLSLETRAQLVARAEKALDKPLSMLHAIMLECLMTLRPSVPEDDAAHVNETAYTASWRRIVARAEDFLDEVREHESEFQMCCCEPSLIKKLQLQIVVGRGHIEQGERTIRRGRPRNEFVPDIVHQLVMIADDAGAQARFSWYDGKTAGPFASFLKVVWEMLPPGLRPISAEAFARQVKDVLSHYRQMAKPQSI